MCNRKKVIISAPVQYALASTKSEAEKNNCCKTSVSFILLSIPTMVFRMLQTVLSATL